MRTLHGRQPGFWLAVKADLRTTCAHRGERYEFDSGWDTFRNVIRLIWSSDSFGAHVAYRLRMALLRRRIPFLPRMLHRYSMRSSQVSIGPGVLLHPGIYIVHGQLVIDGLVEIGPGAVLSPFVTIGLRAGSIQGPVLHHEVHVGTGAKIIGPITIGAESFIGANAVVVDDIPAGVTAVGMPARVIGN